MDFWKINNTSLYREIFSLKDKVELNQQNILDALIKIGNIGAHPESDINLIVEIVPGGAEKMLKFIELLVNQYYIARHEREQLHEDIISIHSRVY